MAIKGLIGKEGNTLGTPEQPWSSIYCNNLIGFPDIDKGSQAINITKTSSGSSYSLKSDPAPENGYISIYFRISSANWFVTYSISSSGKSFVWCELYARTGDNIYTVPVMKGQKAMIDSAANYSTYRGTFYPLVN